MIFNKEWIDEQKEGENDPYVSAILRVGEKVLDLLEKVGDRDFDANDLISEADRELNEGITGNMAAYIAYIVVKCHSRGQEFKRSWNKSYGREDSEHVINPAVLSFNQNL